ncbi:hypothetical protein NM688_g1028 [Phlebia brevispora]|uniref:Uncharacterized protein n=1 Tax=Phlebia brevispora TaxID=194682 RepID=A0ACC1TCN1_9APHY|nr:hypothetical protein NM688_g1028 [Phlebia brevispora]
MAKHSLSYTSVPASAPTSPLLMRGKSNSPVTPQRVAHRSQHRQLSSSPYTPVTTSTPYTPLSLRSFSTSTGSSLATPNSTASGYRRLSISASPENSFRIKGKKGVADANTNWRTRANENGIRVSTGEDSQFADDEADACSEFDTSSFFTTDQSLLPAPFLSGQRRTRAFTHSQPQVTSPLQQITNPTQLSTPARPSQSQSFVFSPQVMNTPPPNPIIFNKYRLRGTVTDPAHTRRRPAFGQTSDLCDIDEDEFVSYPPTFSPLVPTQLHSQTLPLTLHDPFDISGMSEDMYYDAQSTSMFADEEMPQPSPAALSCSVCGTSSGSIAVLEPCTHPLCSACLTSALNIVGEKDMECAVCKAKVNDFKIHKPGDMVDQSQQQDAEPAIPTQTVQNAYTQSFGLLSNNIDSGFQDFIDRAQGASTPVGSGRSSHKGDERSVLRIDNVPWDITPPAIAVWLKHPVERVHVLLDKKGKTLSHAFAEMATPDAARAALRATQNSVLGKGKRARGVTVTRSNQEELMRALFPSWQGNFNGSRPSLSGLDKPRMIATLQHGLITESELKSLLHLIRSPDSHFLKVPSLPFHSLISILSKFPADNDSRVFWSIPIRDLLYDITYAAVQVLMTRIEENPFSEWTNLLTELVRASMDCHAFTAEQMSRLSDLLEAALPRSTSSPASFRPISHTPNFTQGMNHRNLFFGQQANVENIENDPYADLAEEFGVESHLVEALAQRLSRIS